MNWLSFVLGFIVCYIVEAWVLVCFDGKGGVELFDGWLIHILVAPVFPAAPVARRIWKLYRQIKEWKSTKERKSIK